MLLEECMFSEFLKPLPKQRILYTKAINSTLQLVKSKQLFYQ